MHTALMYFLAIRVGNDVENYAGVEHDIKNRPYAQMHLSGFPPTSPGIMLFLLSRPR